MQDPTQPTLPVDPQAGAQSVSNPPGQIVGQAVVAQPVLPTDQPFPPSQVVSDLTPTADSRVTNPQPGESPPDQNPLDVLESILAEAKQKAGQKAPAEAGSGGGDQVANSPTTTLDPTTPTTPPPPTPEELDAQEATHQAEIEQQKQQLMAQITQTPEYQARVQQEAEKAEEQLQTTAGGDGFQIQQLHHTKV